MANDLELHKDFFISTIFKIHHEKLIQEMNQNKVSSRVPMTLISFMQIDPSNKMLNKEDQSYPNLYECMQLDINVIFDLDHSVYVFEYVIRQGGQVLMRN